MGAGRMKDQSDFDLERFIDMFDQALTSNDERVVNALRSLMMMVILTTPEDGNKVAMGGPLRRMYEDQSTILRRLERMEDEMRRYQYAERQEAEKFRHKSGSFETYKWPAQYPTWDTQFQDIAGYGAEVRRQFATIPVSMEPEQIQPVIKKGK